MTGSVQQIEVRGMTCGHCVQAVTDEIGALPGVSQVAVDLASGQVRVTAERALSLDDLRAAVDEAGFELVSG